MSAGERAIRIEAGGVRLYAILNGTPTASLVWEALPLEGAARLGTFGLTFHVPVRAEPDTKPPTSLKPGEMAYDPQGPSIRLSFDAPPGGPGAGPDAPGPVNVFGRITGDASRLSRVVDGARVRLSALDG